jgi:hypothetical protein
MPFSVHVHDQQELTVVGLSGELDVEEAGDLRMLFDMLVEDRHVDVLVDLRLLSFCDSVGLSQRGGVVPGDRGYRAGQPAAAGHRRPGNTRRPARGLQAA